MEELLSSLRRLESISGSSRAAWMFQYLSGPAPQDTRPLQKSTRTKQRCVRRTILVDWHVASHSHVTHFLVKFCKSHPSRNWPRWCYLLSNTQRLLAGNRLTALPQYLGKSIYISWSDASSDASEDFSHRSRLFFSFFLPTGLKRAGTKRSGLRVSFNISWYWSNTTNTFKSWDSNARAFISIQNRSQPPSETKEAKLKSKSKIKQTKNGTVTLNLSQLCSSPVCGAGDPSTPTPTVLLTSAHSLTQAQRKVERLRDLQQFTSPTFSPLPNKNLDVRVKNDLMAAYRIIVIS